MTQICSQYFTSEGKANLITRPEFSVGDHKVLQDGVAKILPQASVGDQPKPVVLYQLHQARVELPPPLLYGRLLDTQSVYNGDGDIPR
jgi:hypothetical protein